MGRTASRTSNLTVDQITAMRPKRVTVNGAMRYLGTCSEEERVAALARVDAAYAESKLAPAEYIGPSVPQARTKLYLRKNLVPAVFVVLEDHREARGTMKGSTDGSFRRYFSFNTERMIVEQEIDDLMLVGIPRNLRSWINEKNKPARLGYIGVCELDSDRAWTDEQRATWKLFGEIANLTETIIDKARRQPAPKHYGNGRIYNPW